MGRPSKMTPETLDKLRQAYLIGANDREAYGYADISHETFYNYIEKHPEFREQITKWQEEPILKARRKVIEDIEKDVKSAQWYLERKKKSEFSLRQEVTGEDGEAIQFIVGRGIEEDTSKHISSDETT